MGSHYIPVGKLKIDKELLDLACPAAGYGETPPPPEIYCPANGFIPDPIIYQDDPELSEAVEPGEGEITLLVGDRSDRKLKFRCTVSDSGKYNVFLYGNNNTLISTTLVNNSAYYDIFLPDSGGIPVDGYNQFNIVIAPEIATNNLTYFRAYTNSGYDPSGGDYLACYFNAPGINSFDSSFYQIRNIRLVEFRGDYPDCTTAYRAFYYCDNLLKVKMDGSFPELTTMNSMCYYCINLQEAILPPALPKVTTLYGIFYAAAIGEVLLPASMPECTNFMSMCYNAVRLRKLALPSSAPKAISFASICYQCFELTTVSSFPTDITLVTSINKMFYKCYKLTGSYSFPAMTVCTNIEEAFAYCYEILSVVFTGAMDLVTDPGSVVRECRKLTTLTMPSSMTGITSTRYLGEYLTYNCLSLVTLNLPAAYQTAADWAYNTYVIFSSFFNNLKLETISEVTNIRETQLGTLVAEYFKSLIDWYQPKFALTSLKIYPRGALATNTIRGALETCETKWDTLLMLDLRYNNIGIAEINRILNLLPNLGEKQNPNYAYFSGNPGAGNSQALTGTRLSLNVWNTGQNPITANVGDFVQISYKSYAGSCTFQETDSLILPASNPSTHKLTAGTKVTFKYAPGVTSGITFGQIYYVINPTATDFQISETPEGSAVAFTGSTAADQGKITFMAKITAIDGNKVTVDMDLPSSTYMTGYATDLDIEQANLRGWIAAL